MGRRPHSRALSVWVNGSLAAHWRIPARGEMELQYDADWIASAEGRPLSLSLPFTLDNGPLKGRAVDSYFDNLLPDSDAIRRRLQSRFRTASTAAFDLLAAIGRDCVGAIQLLDVDERPKGLRRIDGLPLSDADVEAALIRSVSSPLAGGDADADEDLRISLAGAQEKTALLRHRDRWWRPAGSTPTTHIFKLPLGIVGGMRADMRDSVENEWLCATLLAGFGMAVSRCEIARFGSQKALVVERFDRQLHSSGRYWLRLVQEDFCQATATPPALKYERDGGPGVVDIARILRGSVEREQDLRALVKSQILFWMLAATDGHAKNFSLRILRGGQFRATPLYDVVSIWPIVGEGPGKISRHKARMAMAVHGRNRHYGLATIQPRHFVETAARCGIGDVAQDLIDEIIALTPLAIAAAQDALPPAFPQQMLDAVLNGVRDQSRRLESAAPR